jgi:hypothetical protein
MAPTGVVARAARTCQWGQQREHEVVEGRTSGNVNDAGAHRDGATLVRGGDGVEFDGVFYR